MERGPADRHLMEESGNGTNVADVECEHRFDYSEVVPCSRLDRNMYNGTMNGKQVGITYELSHDRSGRPYDSIVDLRWDKIRNFLDVANCCGVRALFPVRFEDAIEQGTTELLKQLEEATGLKAQCDGTPPSKHRPKKVSSEYKQWMKRNVDWETEGLIGYTPR